MDNRTYIKDKNGVCYYFDLSTDTSKNSSSDIADSPIDASRGYSLEDKRIINMKTVGLSGKYSSIGGNNPSFKESSNRLGIIISYFEQALDKKEIYTVYKKGSVFENMMLNKVNLKFGESCNTVEVSLSFTEVVIIGERELSNIPANPTEKDITDYFNYKGYLYDGSMVLTAVEGFEDIIELTGYSLDPLGYLQNGAVSSYQYKLNRYLRAPEVSYTIRRTYNEEHPNSFVAYFDITVTNNNLNLYNIDWNYNYPDYVYVRGEKTYIRKQKLELNCVINVAGEYDYGSTGHTNMNRTFKLGLYPGVTKTQHFEHHFDLNDQRFTTQPTITVYFEAISFKQVVLETYTGEYDYPYTYDTNYRTLKVNYNQSESKVIKFNPSEL